MDRSAIAVDEGCRRGDGEGVADLRVRVTDVVDIDVVILVGAAVATWVLLKYALCLQRLNSSARTWFALTFQPNSRRAQSSGATPKESVWFSARARMVALGAAWIPFVRPILTSVKYCGDHRLED